MEKKKKDYEVPHSTDILSLMKDEKKNKKLRNAAFWAPLSPWPLMYKYSWAPENAKATCNNSLHCPTYTSPQPQGHSLSTTKTHPVHSPMPFVSKRLRQGFAPTLYESETGAISRKNGTYFL